jgi:hypothetical protein
MPRNIIHSDVSVDPESESEALSIAPDVEEEPDVEPEEEEEEAEGDGEGEEGEGEEEDDEGDEREEGDDGDEVEEEGEEADEPEEEEEDEEAADDGDGDAVQEVRSAFRFPSNHAGRLTPLRSCFSTVGPGRAVLPLHLPPARAADALPLVAAQDHAQAPHSNPEACSRPPRRPQGQSPRQRHRV